MKNMIKLQSALKVAVRAYEILGERCASDEAGLYYAAEAVIGRCRQLSRLGDDNSETEDIWTEVKRGHGRVLGW